VITQLKGLRKHRTLIQQLHVTLLPILCMEQSSS